MANTNNHTENTQTVHIVQENSVVIETGQAQAQGAGWIVLLALFVSFLLYRFGKNSRANSIRRWLPVFYTLVWGLVIISITSLYSRGLDGPWKLVIWLIFLFGFFASVGWLRSVMSGVALAIEGRVSEGDSIRIEDIEGEVVSFGLRSISIRGIDGNIHEIPNEKFVSETVANLSAIGGDSICDIYLQIPPDFSPNRALSLAKEVAILTPLASPRHRPEVFMEPNNSAQRRIRIRGYVFDPEYQEHFQSDVISRFSSLIRQEMA